MIKSRSIALYLTATALVAASAFVFATPAVASTVNTASTGAPGLAFNTGNFGGSSFHKTWVQKLSAGECRSLQSAHPGVGCTLTITVGAQVTSSPQQAPAGAVVTQVPSAAAFETLSPAASSSYWTYETGYITASEPAFHATLREEVAKHDPCGLNAACPGNEGVVWNQWEDTSGYECVAACEITNIQRGVIHNGTSTLNGWEDFNVNCSASIGGSSAGCNAGHGDRLYFYSQSPAIGGFTY